MLKGERLSSNFLRLWRRMNPKEPKLAAGSVVEVSWGDRWQVYYRLQELGISSECASNVSLRVEVHTVTQAIQLWSVVRPLTASRQELVQWLEDCWQASNYPEKN